MGLNDYNINQIIVQSRLSVNYKELLLNNARLYILVFAVLFVIDKMYPFMNYILLNALFPILLKMLTEVTTIHIIKKRANKKLEMIVKQLRKNGLLINKIKLKKAKLGTTFPKKIVEHSGVITETEDITIFHDYNNQLKALRQIRYELTVIAPEDKNQYEYGNYTEIVENSEEAKRLYKKLTEK